MVVPLTRNRTLAIAPSASAAVAEKVWAVLTLIVPAAGEAIATVGDTPELTDTVTPEEVVCEPRLSVATAVSV